MATRRVLSLLATLALLSPLAATATAVCAPGPMTGHCPMMAAVSDLGPPCHGTAIQADDCCPEMAAAESAEAVRAIGVTAPAEAAAVVLPPAASEPARGASSASAARSTPLYRLFRALLI